MDVIKIPHDTTDLFFLIVNIPAKLYSFTRQEGKGRTGNINSCQMFSFLAG